MSKHPESVALLYTRYIMALVNGMSAGSLRILLHAYYKAIGGRK